MTFGNVKKNKKSWQSFFPFQRAKQTQEARQTSARKNLCEIKSRRRYNPILRCPIKPCAFQLRALLQENHKKPREQIAPQIPLRAKRQNAKDKLATIMRIVSAIPKETTPNFSKAKNRLFSIKNMKTPAPKTAALPCGKRYRGGCARPKKTQQKNTIKCPAARSRAKDSWRIPLLKQYKRRIYWRLMRRSALRASSLPNFAALRISSMPFSVFFSTPKPL